MAAVVVVSRRGSRRDLRCCLARRTLASMAVGPVHCSSACAGAPEARGGAPEAKSAAEGQSTMLLLA